MSKFKAEENLDDFFIDQIMSMNEQDLNSDFENSGLDLKEEIAKFQQAADTASLSFRKEKLKAARTELEKQINQPSSNSKVISRLKETGSDIRVKLAQLVAGGQIPAEITMAFRDGEEITDEEAEGILEDLIELGVVKDDEQKNSK
tara:strand:- start:20 stop:457 length:438 start_codon:yes stop_codon:yes gene_type:complete